MMEERTTCEGCAHLYDCDNTDGMYERCLPDRKYYKELKPRRTTDEELDMHIRVAWDIVYRSGGKVDDVVNRICEKYEIEEDLKSHMLTVLKERQERLARKKAHDGK